MPWLAGISGSGKFLRQAFFVQLLMEPCGSILFFGKLVRLVHCLQSLSKKEDSLLFEVAAHLQVPS